MGNRGLVLFVRHGVAEDDHPAGDFARGLTAKGRRRFRRFAQGLRGEVALEGIASSPLVRAVQTAEILAGALRVRRVEIHPELAGPSPEALVTLARTLGAGWAIVGHNPTISAAASLLAGEALDPLRKGAVVAFHLGTPRNRWQVAFRTDP